MEPEQGGHHGVTFVFARPRQRHLNQDLGPWNLNHDLGPWNMKLLPKRSSAWGSGSEILPARMKSGSLLSFWKTLGWTKTTPWSQFYAILWTFCLILKRSVQSLRELQYSEHWFNHRKSKTVSVTYWTGTQPQQWPNLQEGQQRGQQEYQHQCIVFYNVIMVIL